MLQCKYNVNPIKNASIEEMYAFVAIIILMGLGKKQNLKIFKTLTTLRNEILYNFCKSASHLCQNEHVSQPSWKD